MPIRIDNDLPAKAVVIFFHEMDIAADFIFRPCIEGLDFRLVNFCGGFLNKRIALFRQNNLFCPADMLFQMKNSGSLQRTDGGGDGLFSDTAFFVNVAK